jgi:hypothetical protein
MRTQNILHMTIAATLLIVETQNKLPECTKCTHWDNKCGGECCNYGVDCQSGVCIKGP